MLYEIVVDGGETPNKCTITPLAYRTDFRLIRVRGEGPLGPLGAPVLLHHEGRCLTELMPVTQSVAALACVDCVWRRLPKILPRLEWNHGQEPQLVKIPDGFVTVYPRVGKPEVDPGNGLATIEAIFIAAALLGNWDLSLLANYYFGRKFLDANAARFQELGVDPVIDPQLLAPASLPARDARMRRRNRGRMPKTSS